MPFDANPPLQTRPNKARRSVAIWLFSLCGMILVMVSLGGATRLTGSGLSIMEWAPLTGTLPPLSEREWQRLYALYQQIPQYQLVNQGFGLDGFKSIFWLEWAHRLWGRLMGLAFALPLGWFLWRRAIDGRLARRLAALLVLGGLQGGVGWFMVASGFADGSVAVAPVRLVLHLSLALLLYAGMLWTALSVWRDSAPLAAAAALPPGLLGLTRLSCCFVALTIVAGGFVAGLKAGLTYNSFPFMDGTIIPPGYWLLTPFWRNLIENVATVQFNHRLVASMTAGIAILTAGYGLMRRVQGGVRASLLVLGAAVVLQYALGVMTLLWVVPVGLGTAHQAMAVLVLTAALVALHTQRATARARVRVHT